MNAERLHAIVIALKADLEETGLLSKLQQLISSLSNQVSQPNQPQYQQQTSQHYTDLLEQLESSAVNDFSPTWKQVLSEIGATGILGIPLADQVKEIFGRNQITPSVALQELQVQANQLQSLSTSVEQLYSGLKLLGIRSDDLDPGQCELGILIPRKFVDNQLDKFAEELRELNSIFGVFSELVTGTRPGFEIKTIASSDLSVFLESAPFVGACIATAIERIVSLYKSLLEIRRLQNELSKQGLEKKSLKGIEDHANTFMKDGIEKLVKEMVTEYKGKRKEDTGRDNELTIELRIALSKIADRIDRGFNIEVRMEEPEIPAEEGQKPTPELKALLKSHEKIQTAATNMQFLKLEGDPILKITDGGNSKPSKSS